MLTLKLFGRPTIILDGKINPTSLRQKPISQKSLGLLIYLAVTRQPVSREALAGLLWSDMHEEKARRNLRVELSKIRPYLETHLDIQRRSVAFDTLGGAEIDAVTFEENLNRPDATLEQIETAVALYDGAFLADFDLRGADLFEEWQLVQRERYRRLALDGLGKLVASYTQSKQVEKGITAARRLLAIEPWLEKGHRQLMRLLVFNGQRSAALAQFDICRQVLDEELGVDPSSETADLHMQILNDEVPSAMALTGLTVNPVAIPPPFQAPQFTQHFVGRQAEIDQLTGQIFGQVGLIGLVGMGGIGKTTLATRLAHGLKDDFPDGVLWADAANSEPLDILGSWGTAFGYDFSGLGDVNNRAAAVRGMLGDKRCLIVLDDVAQVSRIRPLMVGGDQCATLLTTRNLDVATGLEATHLPVGELPSNEGLALLTGILGDARVAAEPDAAAEICAQLQNLPLALEIVAKRLKSRQRRKLADMSKRLADMQNRLGLEISDHAVRASFEVSWSALDGLLKEAFAHLAVFDGLPFTAEALAAVAEIDGYDAEDALYSLVALSMVKEDGDEAYKQHPLLADFAREKLALDGEKESAGFGRMAVFYQAFAEENQADYAALRPWWGNFMAGIRVANRQENWPLLLAYVKSLDEPWFRQARFDEMRTALHMAKGAAEKIDDLEALAWVLLRSGEAAFEQDEFDRSLNYLEASLAISMRLESADSLAKSQYHLGHVFIELGDYEKALDFFNQSESIRLDLNDEEGLAEVYLGKAHAHRFKDEHNSISSDFAEKAIQIQEQHPPNAAYLDSLRLQSSLAYAEDDFESANRFSQKALSLCAKVEDIGEHGAILYMLSAVNRQLNKSSLSVKFALEAREKFIKVGSIKWTGLAESELGRAYRTLSQFDEAQKWCLQALNNFSKISYRQGEAQVHYELSKVYKSINNKTQSERHFDLAKKISEEINYIELLKILGLQ